MRRHVTLPLWAVLVAIFGLLVLGAVAGGAGTKQTDDLQSELDVARTRAANAEGSARVSVSQEYASRQAALDTKEAELDARETAVNAAEVAKKANTITGDGVYQVGVDIQPGTWKTSGSGQSCYWQTSSKSGDILANDNVDGPTTVVIPASAFTFKTNRCGTWQKVG